MLDLPSNGRYSLDLSRNAKALRREYEGTVSFIGAGTLSSKLAVLMASLVDVSKVTVIDYDEVEAHNIANQVYGKWQIGNAKVLALAEVLAFKLAHSREKLLTLLGDTEYLFANLPLSIKEMEFTEDDILESNVVVLAPDNMTCRGAVVNNGVLWGPDSPTDLIIDIRLGEAHNMDVAEAFFLDPKNEQHRNLWNAFYFSDENAQVINPCDKVTSDAWSAMVAAYVVKLFERWLSYQPLKPYYHMVFGDDGLPCFSSRNVPADVLRKGDSVT
jgi:hypothetical protein